MDFNKYLEKFNIEKVEHTEEFLKTLQHNHVTTIPYENLDLVNQKLLVLTPEAVYDKIIIGKRGGYCFEVNCLLSAFLKANGFKVRDFLGRFNSGLAGYYLKELMEDPSKLEEFESTQVGKWYTDKSLAAKVYRKEYMTTE